MLPLSGSSFASNELAGSSSVCFYAALEFLNAITDPEKKDIKKPWQAVKPIRDLFFFMKGSLNSYS